jgi:protein required for attachment to host cells
MHMTRIPHGTWIAVADGAKALFLRNDGEWDALNFTEIHAFNSRKTARTSHMGTDRPGEISRAGSMKSAVEQTDWHQIEEQRFARFVEAELEKNFTEGQFKHLVVVAPAKTLAELRKHFSARLRAAIIREIDKDLTKHPLYEMERLILAS